MIYRRPMLGVIQSANRDEIRSQLSLYKEKGVIRYDKTLNIPATERIQALILAPNGKAVVSAALSASIKAALDSMNLRLTLNTEQILDLADEIIEQSEEDNLALEDVLLFLQTLVTGKAGKIYDRMDIPTFFEFFEGYRQQRHKALLDSREQQNVNYKASGDNTRASEDNEQEVTDMRSVMMDYKKKEFLKRKK